MRNFLVEQSHIARAEALASRQTTGNAEYLEKYQTLRSLVREWAEAHQDIDLGRDIERLIGIARD